jgi:hypothetical protein
MVLLAGVGTALGGIAEVAAAQSRGVDGADDVVGTAL